MKIAVIGAGISGMSVAQMLGQQGGIQVVVYEAAERPGGLIKCDVVNGSLFHRTGGHVFNSKREDVWAWFRAHFDLERDFGKATRNATVILNNGVNVPYPIENHVYLLDEKIQQAFIEDLIAMAQANRKVPDNFEEFLRSRFGDTLYELYFRPYNYKVWRSDLSKVPLTWLEGKLPMPTLQQLMFNNINHVKEQSFVHSSFFYPKMGGSQFIANQLAKGLDIRYSKPITELRKVDGQWLIHDEYFDKVIFCGNIKYLPAMLSGSVNIDEYAGDISDLQYHGTTTVFCEIDQNPYSWVYLPSDSYEAHRVICTGNFAVSNNAEGKFTGTIEFTDEIAQEEILKNLSEMPLKPKYITHNYAKYTYPIQNPNTRQMLTSVKQKLANDHLFLLGRFADWEYYNMDAAIGAAMDLLPQIKG